jgi:hypothetical protein
MMEGMHSSERSKLTRVTRRNIPEGDIIHSHRREDLKSSEYIHFVSIHISLSTPNVLSLPLQQAECS